MSLIYKTQIRFIKLKKYVIVYFIQKIQNTVCQLYILNLKKNFFSAWLEESSLKHYEANKEQLGKACKTAAFREAVDAIEYYISSNGDGVRFGILFLTNQFSFNYFAKNPFTNE